MSENLLIELKSLFEDHAAKLPGVTVKRLFGCDGFFKDGSIFGLIWKTGRIGVKLPDVKAFDELMAKPGAELWMPSEQMAMSSWVLVPESFHDDEAALDAWIKRAHALAVPKPPKGAKKAKAPAAPVKKKPSPARKAPARKAAAAAPRRGRR